MFYPELLDTEVESEHLNQFLIDHSKRRKQLESILDTFHQTKLTPAKKSFAALSPDSESFVYDALEIKRQLLEALKWLNLFYAVASEKIPSYSYISPIEMKRQQSIADIEGMLKVLKVSDPLLIEKRKEPLSAFDQQIEQALANAERHYIEEQQRETDPEQKRHRDTVIEKQRFFFRGMAQFISAQRDKIEKAVVESARGVLLTNPEQFPFSALYSLHGDIYIILDLKKMSVGQGRAKTVNRCVHLQTGTVYASVQLMRASSKSDYFWQLWVESRLLKRLRGKPGIIPLKTSLCFPIQEKRELYLIEQFFHDGSLHAYFQNTENPSIPLPKRLYIADQILQGVLHIHEAGYIHADIKPANILLDNLSTDRPSAVLTDFESAFHHLDERAVQSDVNTPRWSPPEVARKMLKKTIELNLKHAFKRDIWSLGALFYRLFFDAPLPWNDAQDTAAYPFIAQLAAGWIPSSYKTHPLYPLIEKMLEVEPENRPTIQEVVALFHTLKKKLA